MEMTRAVHNAEIQLERKPPAEPRPAVSIRGYAFRMVLLCPVLVYALPDFTTTLEEDAVLLILFIYWLLRALKEDRVALPPHWQAGFNAVILGWIYGLGWIGLLRGYEEAAGRGLVLFPVLLLTAVGLRPEPRIPLSRGYRTLLPVLGGLSLVLFLMMGVIAWCGPSALWDTGLPSLVTITPKLILIPILGCAALLSRVCAPLVRGRDHRLLLGMLMFAAFCAWSGNARTWYLWYTAGEQERAWTPYKYDAPEDIAGAERKPLEAVITYNAVYQRILQKGDIPRFLNWPFYLRYRMAYQAMRKNQGAGCAALMPLAPELGRGKIQLLKRLWHPEFLAAARSGEPDYPGEGRIWVDAELSADESTIYLLDRFGRVYSSHEAGLVLEWEPGGDFFDAVDLALSPAGGFLVVRESGSIWSSRPDALFPESVVNVPLEGELIGLDYFPERTAALVVNTRGETWTAGKAPAGFPASRTLNFNKPVIADLKIDPDGKGYYLLDIYGAVHSNHPGGPPSLAHTSPPVPQALIPYWAGTRMAIGLALDPRGRGMYVYNRLGEVFSIAVDPYWTTYRPPRAYPYRGVALLAKRDGTLTALESNGSLVALPSRR